MMRIVLGVFLLLGFEGSASGATLDRSHSSENNSPFLAETTGQSETLRRESNSGKEKDSARKVIEEIRAPRVYYTFLSFLDNDSVPADQDFSRAAVRRQLDALRVVLSDSLVEELRIGKGAETGRPGVLAQKAGQTIERWWRRKDPYPATEANERLQEHLKRVSYAFEHYSRPQYDHRLDDRGRVYVRYGPPNESRGVYRGEFWTYDFQVAAEFLFVCERGDGCDLGQPIELIPPHRRYGTGPSERGMRKALRSLSTLESIYETLSHHRSRYGTTYADLLMYNEQIRQRLDNLSTPMNTRPHSFLHQKVAEIKQEEAAARRRREKVVPTARSTAGNEFEDLPISARWVRSLTDEGNTEVSLYWSVPRPSLRPSIEQAQTLEAYGSEEGGYLLSSSFVQFSDSYERRSVRTDHLFASQVQSEEEAILKPRQKSFLLNGSPHAALQVELLWASIDRKSESVRPELKLKVGTSRADSLQSLRDDPSILEMSDLEPVLRKTDTTSILEAPVYPFRELPTTRSLALRFDIYHLSTGAEGRTEYTVQYEVLRKSEQSGFEQLWRDDQEKRTAVESQFQGRGAHTEEYILLDPTNWTQEEAQAVRVRVRVTDQKSGQEVARSAKFTLSPTEK